jgi:60 kDa SS-A/Ro ribonucleoprotein
VWATAKALSTLLGGGTDVSAPLRELQRRQVAPDLVIILSDNQSWMDARQSGATQTLREWQALKARNPQAKLVCIDLQPYTNTQIPEQADVLNIGGFSDQVFEIVAAFANGSLDAGHWVAKIEALQL